MKNPLRYQLTNYDCGPTSFENALSYLYERDELPPEFVQQIPALALNESAEGLPLRGGTSQDAMGEIADLCNEISHQFNLGLQAQRLRRDDVELSENSPIFRTLERDGCVVLRCNVDVNHYVLVTGRQSDRLEIFDPFLFDEDRLVADGIEIVRDEPLRMNRLVPIANFETPGVLYTFHTDGERNAILMWRE